MLHRLVNVENLVGITQIAARLNVAQTTVDNWIKGIRAKGHDPFPSHITVVGKTRVWDWSDVEEWHRSYVPQKGGAPEGDRNGKRTQLTVRTESGGWRNAG